MAVLTQAGLDTLRTASRTHLDGVVTHFVSLLDEGELNEIGEVCERLATQ